MVARVWDYLLVFKCSAKTREGLKVMDDAVMALHRQQPLAAR